MIEVSPSARDICSSTTKNIIRDVASRARASGVFRYHQPASESGSTSFLPIKKAKVSELFYCLLNIFNLLHKCAHM
jgi:hypothetical protein